MLALALLSAPVPAQLPSEAVDRTVTAIELHLPPGMTAADLPDRVTVRRGQPLSRSAVRESIHRLWATNRFAAVTVRAFPESDGVRVVFELTGRRCFEHLSAEGNDKELSDAQVVQASGLSARKPGEAECPENAEYYPERLRRAVEGIRAAYRDRGFDEANAQVELYEQTGGIVVLFRVTEGQPTKVAGLTLAGDPGLPLSRVMSEAGLELGATLDASVLSGVTRGLRSVLRRERYFRAQVGEPVVQREGRLATISVPVAAGPRFSIHFHGNRTFGDKQLQTVLGYSGDDPLDTTLLARLERRLLSFYRERGFTDATVVVGERLKPDGSEAILSFDIEEGAPLFVERIEFSGNVAVEEQQLREVVVGHVRARAPALGPEAGELDDPLNLEGRVSGSTVASAVLDPPNIYNEEAYRNAADSLTAMYRDRGYLQAEVSLSDAVIERNRARVRFRVEEGPRAMVRALTVSGAPPGFVRPNLKLKVTEPLNASLIEEGQTQLTRALNRDGYLFAAVVANLDQEESSVTYDLHPGPQVRVGEIRFGGLARTEEQLLRANLTLTPGTVLDPEQLFESQRNLLLTGAFRQVTVRVADPDAEASTKDVEVMVKESARYSGEVGGGLSLSEGPRFVVDAVAPNWNGSGVNLSARGKLNYVGASALSLFPQCVAPAQQADPGVFISHSERAPPTTSQCLQPGSYLGFNALGGRGNVSLHQPRVFGLLPLKVGARADLVFERVFRPLYRFTRFAGIVGGDWTANEWSLFSRQIALSAAVQYELEHDRVAITPDLGRADDRQNARLNERYPAGYYTMHNVRVSANLDFRDDKTNPTSGGLMQTTAELTHGLTASVDHPFFEGEEVDVTQDFKMLTLKTSANVTVYLPVPLLPRVVFAASARAGQIFQVREDHATEPVLPKRFFMGGNTSMRGFREDALIPADRRETLHQEVADCRGLVSRAGCSSEALTVLGGQEPLSPGGRQFALAKAELRFPAFSSVDLGLFFEMGNLWYDPRNILTLRLTDFRYVAGAGFRYGTPIGPLAFDFGFNLAPDYEVNEQLFNFHFSIGLF